MIEPEIEHPSITLLDILALEVDNDDEDVVIVVDSLDAMDGGTVVDCAIQSPVDIIRRQHLARNR